MLLRQAIRYQVISPFVLKPLLIVPRFYSTNPKETFYTLEEVAKHDNEDDCWMVINGKVYDVTDYIDDHPGGDVILDGAGKDATADFEGNEHSDEAREHLADYWIGCIKE